MDNGNKLVFWMAAVMLFIVAALPHFWKLGSIPEGFYLDEASNAYDAYCIALTGADEYGVPHPVFFQSFGDYQDPVMIYFLAPLVKKWGLTQQVARFPSAFFQILASLAFGFVVYAYGRNKWLSLIGTVIFSLTPWTFPISRASSGGYTAMLFGMNLGWLFSLAALRKQSRLYAVIAGIGWALAMYAHNIGRPVTALWLIGFALVLNRLLIKRWRVWLAFVLSFVTCMVPMIISVLGNPGSMTARFGTIGILQGNSSYGAALRQIAVRYAGYFSPRFLFLKGDTNFRHHTGFGGELFLFTVPLILAGVYGVVRFAKGNPYYRLLAVALLLYPAAAALTIETAHAGRCVDGVIPWILLTMVGARVLWLHRSAGRMALMVICAVGLIESALYLHDYFGAYQTRARDDFMTEETDAFKYCFAHLGSNEVLYVSASVFSPNGAILNQQLKPFFYVYPLFYGKVDPHEYQQGGFPTGTVRLYEGGAPRSGFILRSNYVYQWPQGSLPIVSPNTEPLPPDASLSTVIPCLSSKIKLQYEIFRVP